MKKQTDDSGQPNDPRDDFRSKRGDKKGKKPGRFGLFNSIFIVFLILFLISSLYSIVADQNMAEDTIPISELVHDIGMGKVALITVRGDDLIAEYQDKTIKRSKKEADAPVTETFATYGLTPDKLNAIKISIEGPSGFWFWLGQLAPFLAPLLFLALIIWFLTRQVRGTGLQAFSFGQSKARITMPDDKKQRVTFKDVAGAKEAKQELAEIVDFLKNPKKFLEIGAVIPKGILLMGAPGTGKCVSGNTMIVTSKGIIAIQDIPKYFFVNEDNTVEGLNIVTLDEKEGLLKTAVASHWYCLGDQKTLLIKTDSGISIEGTPEHPLIVVDKETGFFKFKRIDEIKEGEWLAVGSDTQSFGSHTRIPSPDIAYLMGVLTGDGCLTIKDRVMLSTADNEILERVQKILNSHFGVQLSKSSGKYDYELRNVHVKETLISWGLGETYARHKRIPDWISMAPKEYVCQFIRGLFDTDGTVEKRGSVSISSSSRSLVNSMQFMLLNLGIVARSYERKKKHNGQMQYYIQIYGDFVQNFKDQIGFLVKRKISRLEAVCLKQRNTNINLIPLQSHLIGKVWRQAIATTNISLNRTFYAQSPYKNVKRYMSGERTPSQHGMNIFIENAIALAPSVSIMPEVAHLKNLSSGKFFFTQVKKINKSQNKVYDLTVPITHNFIANGLINHNTLLARAVAGEAGVAFFSISGSEFVEMFVGVGASRVRDLFKMAKETAPAIIFVDEIDAVGRVRGTGVGGGNDEREQTLNQILVEMDGFEPNEKVIVMAATNRPDVLDPALLRPGRFDRRVTIDLPDRNDREEILKIHSTKKPFAEDVVLRVIAERTPGFSGADLYSLMNEGAILAARENRNKISQYDLIRAIEKVMLGPERKSHLLSKKEKEITAYHEAGHALVSSVLPYADPVHKISIISRGRAAGYTLHLPLEDRKMQSKNEFLDDIAVSLGGYVVEKMMFGDVTTGPSNDLQVSTALARDMVTKYGMSDRIGALALEGSGGRAMFGKGIGDKEYSEKVGADIDAEVSKIMSEAYKKAEDIVTKHRPALDAIAQRLIDIENLERDEYETIIIAHGIQPKRKLDIEHQA
ncbi:MAG: ATP-dependent zinc metalloprotease FtsH [bacterium]|nr:ATP-dependent zinc metalloprotease FtsH [bacterium]